MLCFPKGRGTQPPAVSPLTQASGSRREKLL